MFLYSLDGRTAHRYGTTPVRWSALTHGDGLESGYTHEGAQEQQPLENPADMVQGCVGRLEARFSAQAEALTSLASVSMTDELRHRHLR